MADDPQRERILALGRAIRNARESAGRSQTWLGEALAETGEPDGIGDNGWPFSQSAVGDWEHGKLARPMPPERVFLIERVLGVKAGSISKAAGYLPVSARNIATVEQAIEADLDLTPEQREDLVALYRGMRTRTAEKRKSR